MATTTTTITLEQFLQLAEKKPALEFEDGEVTQKVSPRGKHSVLQKVFVAAVDQVGFSRKLAQAFPELRTTFGGRSYVPDLSVYRWDRIPVDERGEVGNEFFAPPDIAIEIKSPGQRTAALKRRCVWYVLNGVQVSLLADPEDYYVLRFAPNEEPQLLRGSDPIALDTVLPGFLLKVDDLFAPLRMT